MRCVNSTGLRPVGMVSNLVGTSLYGGHDLPHSMAIANLNKSEDFVTNTTAASKYIHRRPRISMNWNPTFQTSLHKISKVIFFRLKFFFQEQKKNFQGTTSVQFFMYCRAKKNFGAIRKFLKFFIFENLHKKEMPERWDFNYADFGPLRYVLWCCGGICHELITFFQICFGHTV